MLRDISPRNRPSPTPRSEWGVVYFRIVLSPEKASRLCLFLNISVLQGGVVSTSPNPPTQLEDHPSSAVRECLFNLFAATLLIGGRSSIRNLRTHHAVVTRTHYMVKLCTLQGNCVHGHCTIRLEYFFEDKCHKIMAAIAYCNICVTYA